MEPDGKPPRPLSWDEENLLKAFEGKDANKAGKICERRDGTDDEEMVDLQAEDYTHVDRPPVKEVHWTLT